MGYKNKNIILGVVFVLLSAIIYRFAIKKTINHKEQLLHLKKEKDLLNNASSQIAYLQNKNRNLEAILQKDNISVSSSFQQILLQKINKYATENSIEIIRFKEPHIFKNNELQIVTYQFALKGSFVALLSFFSDIENEGLGEIIATSLIKKRNYGKNKNYLILQVFLKRIK